MSLRKLSYGIDLGTTNSAIARVKDGESVIIKNLLGHDTMPSCVSIDRKKVIRCGFAAKTSLAKEKLAAMNGDYNSLNSYEKFKRLMGTDKRYFSSNADREYSSEELSAEILKTLKSFVIDEKLRSVVITVPAKFTINQKDATLRAGHLAGFEQCELLQEPIAASLAFGIDSASNDGEWLVFDFGGGTFDAALLRVDDGIIKVLDTEGDNYLGGKNLDEALVDEIIIPYLRENFRIENMISDTNRREILRQAMTHYAEEVNIHLSFNESHTILTDLGDIPLKDESNDEVSIDLTLSRDDVTSVIKPIFQKALDLCLDLLKRNGLEGKDLETILLIGGPTYSPLVREMIRKQIADKINTKIDPMTAVARGAALYASTIDVDESIVNRTRDVQKVQLKLQYTPTSVQDAEIVTIKLGSNDGASDSFGTCYAEISRSDRSWHSGRISVDSVGDICEVPLTLGRANCFKISAFDDIGNLLPCEPDEFSIIQGTQIGSSTLPYHIGIEINRRISGRAEISPIRGLEKNRSLPATGVESRLKTQTLVRPGNKDDLIKIPIFQGEDSAEGTLAVFNEHVYTVIISGEDLPSLLPAGSPVELTVKADRSEAITLEAYFPSIEHNCFIEVPRDTKQKEIDAEWLDSEIERGIQSLSLLRQFSGNSGEIDFDQTSDKFEELKKLLLQGRGDFDRKKQVLENLRKLLRTIDRQQKAADRASAETQLKEAFYDLEDLVDRTEGADGSLGGKDYRVVLDRFKQQIPEVIKQEDLKIIKELTSQIRSIGFIILDTALGINMEVGLLNNFNEDFDIHEWSDPLRARNLINQGLQMTQNNPRKEQLREIVLEIYKLLPEADKPIFPSDESLLTR